MKAFSFGSPVSSSASSVLRAQHYVNTGNHELYEIAAPKKSPYGVTDIALERQFARQTATECVEPSNDASAASARRFDGREP
jgi:hypothetical protein